MEKSLTLISKKEKKIILILSCNIFAQILKRLILTRLDFGTNQLNLYSKI